MQNLFRADLDNGLKGGRQIMAIAVEHWRTVSHGRLTQRRMAADGELMVKPPAAQGLPHSRHLGKTMRFAELTEHRLVFIDALSERTFPNVSVYSDDGWSGTNFERPDWKRLISDIEAGKVGIVLVKDLSRVGRDYLRVGFYTEVTFPQNGVRFIAVNNGVDSANQSENDFAPFLNIMNDFYARDTSKKVSAVYRAKGNKGEHTGNHPIYGYLKDPENKQRWIIDEEAAAVVRRIFRMVIDGKGVYQIADILSEEKVLCPSAYLAAKGVGNRRNSKIGRASCRERV